jgi:hypothetical protein
MSWLQVDKLLMTGMKRTCWHRIGLSWLLILIILAPGEWRYKTLIDQNESQSLSWNEASDELIPKVHSQHQKHWKALSLGCHDRISHSLPVTYFPSVAAHLSATPPQFAHVFTLSKALPHHSSGSQSWTQHSHTYIVTLSVFRHENGCTMKSWWWTDFQEYLLNCLHRPAGTQCWSILSTSTYQRYWGEDRWSDQAFRELCGGMRY